MEKFSTHRALRLQEVFSPYPTLTVKVSINSPIPIKLLTPKDISILKKSNSYIALVSSFLVHDKLPMWIEPVVLHCALCLQHQDQGIDIDYNKMSKYLAKLQSIINFILNFNKNHLAPSQKTNYVTPTPDIKKLWVNLRQVYFPTRTDLDFYKVEWATRKRVRLLAKCDLKKKVVTVASPMRQSQCHGLLEPLLFHEMCHAVLGEPKIINGRAIYHGKDFKALEQRHPKIRHLDHWIKNGGWDKAVSNYSLQK